MPLSCPGHPGHVPFSMVPKSHDTYPSHSSPPCPLAGPGLIACVWSLIFDYFPVVFILGKLLSYGTWGLPVWDTSPLYPTLTRPRLQKGNLVSDVLFVKVCCTLRVLCGHVFVSRSHGVCLRVLCLCPCRHQGGTESIQSQSPQASDSLGRHWGLWFSSTCK